MAAKNRNPMKSSHVLPIFLGLLTFALLGCPRQPPPPVLPKPVSFQESLQKLQARTAYWQGYQAKLRIRAEGTKGKLRFQAIAIANLPDQVRFEAFSLVGQTVALFILNKDKSSLWIPSEKVIFTARSPETLIEYFLGVSVSAKTLAYSLVGVVPGTQPGKLGFRPAPFGWTAFPGEGEAAGNFEWEFLDQPVALKAVSVKEGTGNYRVEYDPPVKLDPQEPPGKIQFQSSQWHMDINVEQASPFTGFQISTFAQPSQAGAREINLDLIK